MYNFYARKVSSGKRSKIQVKIKKMDSSPMLLPPMGNPWILHGMYEDRQEAFDAKKAYLKKHGYL